jgi:hypothetical protein
MKPRPLGARIKDIRDENSAGDIENLIHRVTRGLMVDNNFVNESQWNSRVRNF